MKKTPNAYILYRKEEYPFVRSTFPNYTFSDISKYLGKKWRHLSYDEKTVYYDKAEELKQARLKKMREQSTHEQSTHEQSTHEQSTQKE
tara:strand:+ start:246 stop:512 length:267 start_codon:yes stop_codon:yes gene_type:complete